MNEGKDMIVKIRDEIEERDCSNHKQIERDREL